MREREKPCRGQELHAPHTNAFAGNVDRKEAGVWVEYRGRQVGGRGVPGRGPLRQIDMI